MPTAISAGLTTIFMLTIVVAIVWTLIWKGIALWHAARNRQTVWFIIMLVLNTLGILEIVYLVFFRQDENEIAIEDVIVEEVETIEPNAE